MTDHPFARILLATEHTEFDAGAERVAFELARRCGVPLAVIVPIESNPEYEAAAPERALSVEQAVHARNDDLRAVARAASVAIDILVRRGEEPYREIVAEARARVGPDRRPPLRQARLPRPDARLVFGSTAKNIAGLADCPVLLVGP